MALAIDGSSPALATITGTSTTITSASFTPPAGCQLWVGTAANNDSAGATISVASSPSLGAFNQRILTTVQEVPVAWHWQNVAVSQAYTVTSTRSITGQGMSLLVRVITGQETTPGGATATNNSNSGTVSQTITTTRANSLILAASADWSQSGLATYGTSQTNLAEHNLASMYTSHFWRYDGLVAVSTYTINQTAPTGQDYNLAVVEIREPAGGAVTTTAGRYLPPRQAVYRAANW